MAYCTAQDLIDEGVDQTVASSARATKLIAIAGAYIDRMTGQWFEDRPITLVLDSPGGAVLPLPVPAITIDTITVADAPFSDYYLVDPNIYDPRLSDTAGQVVNNYQIDANGDNPRLIATNGTAWPAGPGVVTITGHFGRLEGGATPLLINYLAARLVIRELPAATDIDGQEARKRPRITSESVDGQSYSLVQLTAAGQFTGDPELDNIIMAYQRPLAWGVA